jgi:hypothetical protein
MHNYCTPHIIKDNFENFLIHLATTYAYLKCIVYDKLSKPRQSFRITLYMVIQIAETRSSGTGIEQIIARYEQQVKHTAAQSNYKHKKTM